MDPDIQKNTEVQGAFLNLIHIHHYDTMSLGLEIKDQGTKGHSFIPVLSITHFGINEEVLYYIVEGVTNYI